MSPDPTLRRRPIRIVLDSFALVTGVLALVLALAVSSSASALVRGPIDGVDRSLVVVSGTAPSDSGVETGLASSSLTPGDVSALGNAGYVPDILAIAPTTGRRASVHSLDRTSLTDVIGSTDGFAAVRGDAIDTGRFLTAAEVKAGAPSIVLGRTVVNSLFAGEDPIGRDVVVANQAFNVVGTFRSRGFSSGHDQDDLVVIPISTAWKAFPTTPSSPIDQVLIRGANPAGASAAAQEATAVLLRRHGIVNPAEADFKVVTQRELGAKLNQTALALRRILEIAGTGLLLSGAVHLALVANFRRRTPRHPQRAGFDNMTALAGVLFTGLVCSIAGIVFAIILAPALHRLAVGLPRLHVTVYAALAGTLSGVLAAVLSILPTMLRSDESADVALEDPLESLLPPQFPLSAMTESEL